MTDIIQDEEFNERPPNAVYKCKVHQRFQKLIQEGTYEPATYATLGRTDEHLFSLEGIEGFAYLSDDQPYRRTSPLMAPQHESEVPLVYEFVVAGFSPQEEFAVIRVNSKNLEWLGDK